MSDEYISMLSDPTLSAEQKNDIEEMISCLQDEIQEYSSFSKERLQLQSNKSSSKIITKVGTPQDKYYDAAITTVTAWFQMKGYKLSAELLTHNRANKKRNSLYLPIYGSRVCESPLFGKLRKSSNRFGSSAFPNQGSTVERDLYYSIHRFNWSRTGSYVTITDTYDWSQDKSYTSIVGIAVNTMYAAQQRGILIPYKISITRNSFDFDKSKE